MLAQHKDEMHWENAPPWATHIVGWYGEPQSCYWAQEIDGQLFEEEQRETRVFAFGLVDADDKDDTFGWVVISTRPNNQIQRAR